MQEHPCIACMGLIFAAQGLLIWMFPPLSSVCAGYNPPEGGRADVPTCLCSRGLHQWGQQLVLAPGFLSSGGSLGPMMAAVAHIYP